MIVDPNIIFRGTKRLSPARGEPGQLCLHEIQLVHDLREVIPGLGGLTKGEVFGIEVGHTALTGSRLAITFLPGGRRALSFFGDGGLDCGGDRCD